MSKTVFGVALGAVVLGGFGYVLWYTHDQMPRNETSATQVASSSAAKLRTLNDIIAEDGNFICAFTNEDPGARNSGTLYISGENFRGDFSTAHMIQYGGFVYTWADAASMGTKTPRVAERGMAEQQGFDMQAALAYDCKDWTPDLTKFDLPAKVKFQEVAQ